MSICTGGCEGLRWRLGGARWTASAQSGRIWGCELSVRSSMTESRGHERGPFWLGVALCVSTRMRRSKVVGR